MLNLILSIARESVYKWRLDEAMAVVVIWKENTRMKKHDWKTLWMERPGRQYDK